MSLNDLIENVKLVCLKNKVEHLSLFGSFAKGTATQYSDVDFVVFGCPDKMKLENDLTEIDTLRKIDIFYYDEIKNSLLIKEIQDYAKQIY